MTRREQIQAAASERYKDSEFRVPNMYCFIEGAEWADRVPSDRWHSFKDKKPEKGQHIILRIDHEDMRMASLEIIKFDPVVFPSEMKENVKWFPIPEF